MADSSSTNFSARPGGTFDVKIVKTVNRAGALKTLERLFMSDKAFRAPIDARAANHKDRPKRRGGRIYTKYTRKVHPDLKPGDSATIPATAQHARDLASVASFVEVA
jgi:hypothetical protein